MGSEPEWIVKLTWRYHAWSPILTIGEDTFFTGRWKESIEGKLSVEVQHSYYRVEDYLWFYRRKKYTQIEWVSEDDISIERIFSCGGA